MNKYLIILTFIFSSFGLLKAQEGYLMFTKDKEIHGKIFFKGEIYPLVEKISRKKISYIISGLDSTITNKDIKILENVPEDITSYTNNVIKLKSDDTIDINIKNLNNITDTAWFVSENNKKILLLSLSNYHIILGKNQSGNSFRLIIPGYPSINYSFNKLAKLDEFNNEKDEADNENKVSKKGYFNSFTYLNILFYILILLGFGISIWVFILFNNKRKNNLNTAIYENDKTFKEFLSENNIDIDDLFMLNKIKYNNKIITSDFYHKSFYQVRDSIDRSLIGKKLIVGKKQRNNKESLTETNDFNFNEEENQPTRFYDNINNDTLSKQTDQITLDDISQLLRKQERNIINEIQNATTRKNDNTGEINRLRNELTRSKEEYNKYKKDKENLEIEISKLNNDKNNLGKKLDFVTQDQNQREKEHSQLLEKVISVDYLKQYCQNVIDYLTLCYDVSSKAYYYFNKLSQQYPKQVFVIGLLLIKFQNSINAYNLGSWMQINQDINDSGITTNKKIIRGLNQIQSSEEKLREFQRLLFVEVLIPLNNGILILAEELRNIERFQHSIPLSSEIHSTFEKFVTELINKAKYLGIENKYVPLFKNHSEYLGVIKGIDREKSEAYLDIKGLQRNEIAEIISYGVKTPFDDTKTITILA